MSLTTGAVHTYAANTNAFVDITAAPDGRFFIAYKLNSTNIAVEVYNPATMNWDNYASFTAANTGHASLSDDIDLVAASDGSLHIVYRFDDGDGQYPFSEPRGVGYGNFNGTSWTFSNVDAASDPSGGGGRNFDDPSLVVDSSGKAHVTYKYSEIVSGFSDYYVKYATNAGGSFASSAQASYTLDTNTGINELSKPIIKVGPDGTLHLTYLREDNINGTAGNLYYQTKSANGAWSAEVRLDGTPGTINPHVYTDTFIDAAGKLHIFFVQSGAVYDINNVSGSFATTLAIAASENVASVRGYQEVGGVEYMLVTDSGGDTDLFSRTDGGAWQENTQAVLGSRDTDVAINSSGQMMIVLTTSDLRNITFATDQVAVAAQPPVLAANAGSTVSEGGNDTITQTELRSTDNDTTAASLSYKLNSSVVNGALFLDNDSNGILSVGDTTLIAGSTFTQSSIDAGKLRYQHNGGETTSDSFQFDLTDGTTTISNQTFAITVVPTNDAPSIALPAAPSVSENGGAVALDNTIQITDPDSANQTVTLTVTGGTASVVTAGLTSITGNGSASVTFSGTLANINLALDGLTFTPNANFTGSASIKIDTNDGAGGTASKVISLTVSDLNPVIGNASASVAETATTGTGVYTFSPTGDTNGLSYSITGGNTGGKFAIDNTGKVTVNGALDHETTGTYTLTIAVDDEDTDSNADATATLTVTVTNVNDAPIKLGGAAPVTLTAVEEDVPSLAFEEVDPYPNYGDDIGQLIANRSSSVDTNDAIVGVAIVGDASTSTQGRWQFSIDGSHWHDIGAVSTSNALLLDASALGTSAFIRFAPAQNFHGEPGRLTVRLVDNSATLEFTSLNGAGEPALKYYSGPYGGTAQVSDSANSLDFSITISSVNDAPVISASGRALTAVPENATDGANSGMTVAALLISNGGSATDVEGDSVGIAATAAANANGTWQYKVGTGAWTDIGSLSASNALLLGPADLVRFVPNANYSGTDTGSLSFKGWDLSSGMAGTKGNDTTGSSTAYSTATATTTVVVSDTNPTIGNNSASVSEAVGIGATVHTVTASGDTDGLTYAITGGNTGGVFTIDSTGRITVSGTLDHEATGTYTLTVGVDDEDADTVPDSTATITVTVTNAGVTTPTDSNGAVNTVAENAANGTEVGITAAATASDPQSTGITYSLIDNAGGRFAIDFATGVVTVADASKLDHDVPGGRSHQITVQASDGQGGTSTQTFTIPVTNVDEAPTLVAPAVISLTDTAAADEFGSQTGILSGSDPDGAPLTYGINQGAGGNSNIGGIVYDVSKAGTYGTLHVQSSTGKYVYVPNDAAINALTAHAQDSFQVTASDGSLSDTKVLMVNLTGANDAPLATSLTQVKSFTEDAGAVALDAIVVTDADPGQTVTATLTLSRPAAGALSTGTFGSATSTYNTETGVWVVVGSVEDVNTALAAVAFSPVQNWDQNITIATHIEDALGTGPADGTISLATTPVNDAPVLATNTGASTETSGLITITPSRLTAGDVDDADTGLTYTVTTATTNGTLFRDGNGNGVVDGGEALGSSATFTQADIGANLVKYLHSGGADTADSFTFTLADGGEDGVAPLTGQSFAITVASRPVVTPGGASPGYTEDASATTLIPGLTISDSDSADLTGATLSITDFVAGDLLGFTNQNGITGSYNAATGVLFLSGTATQAEYQAALRSITYSSTSENPATGAGNADRVIQITVADGALASTGVQVTLNVANANDAPILDPSQAPVLTPIGEDLPAPASGSNANSTLVSSLLVGATDPDTGALQGIAVTGVSAKGTLFYSTDGGLTWAALTGSVSASAALLLHGDAQLYFQPDADENGTLTDAITFKAWDRTSGASNGQTGVDTTGSAFSAASDTASVVITPVNDAPHLADTALALNSVVENAGAPVGAVGTLISALVAGVSDVDTGADSGVAVVGNDTANGTWYFSTDGGAHWQVLGNPSASVARLLAADASTRVYFQPSADYQGTITAGLTIRAWDGTSGTNGGTADTATTGGSSAFSLASDTVSVVVLSDIDGDGQADLDDDDIDNDGRPNSIESPVPDALGSGTGDGNGDGKADAEQVNVASLPTVGLNGNTARYATLAVADGLTLTQVTNAAAPSGGLPRGAKMPLGQFDFTIGGLATGHTTTVSLFVEASLGLNTYYKQNYVTGKWDKLPVTITTVGTKTKIDFELTDGGDYDADRTANGVIVDPGVVAMTGPQITSNGGEVTAPVELAENSTAVTVVTATAETTVTYAITGGADRAKFTIDATTGALSFVTAPDFEKASDQDKNNIYIVEVTATDRAHNSETQTLSVTVKDVKETVDGVMVTTDTITNGDGSTSQVITIPVVTPGRVDEVGAPALADIPLVQDSSGNTLLIAQLPTGFGLTAIGPAAPQPAGSSLTGLIREIKAYTEVGSADQGLLTSGGSGFLDGLPSNRPLVVQTLVPTTASNTAPSQPLVIIGASQTPGEALTALVIDARGLPSGTAIQLEHVEFAAVVGAVRLIGGNGSQQVWGDSAAQYMVLGADDDVLHGGGGNDYVGSGGGNDRLYGDAGNDTVSGGEGHDYVYGGSGKDRLYGGSGNDTLKGDSGNDWIDGGLGRDKMWGGSGRDVFDFNSVKDSKVGSQRDVIYDFKSGQDRIDLRGIDANALRKGNQKFTWAGADGPFLHPEETASFLRAGFTGEAGQLRYSKGILMGDTDGDRRADFQIKIVGYFSSGDVIL